MKNYKKKLAGLVGILLTATMILSGCGSKEKEDTLETPEAVPTDAAVEAESTADNQSAETDDFAPDHKIKNKICDRNDGF